MPIKSESVQSKCRCQTSAVSPSLKRPQFRLVSCLSLAMSEAVQVSINVCWK